MSVASSCPPNLPGAAVSGRRCRNSTQRAWGKGLRGRAGAERRGGGGSRRSLGLSRAGRRQCSPSSQPRPDLMDALCGSGELGSKFWVRRCPRTEGANWLALTQPRGEALWCGEEAWVAPPKAWSLVASLSPLPPAPAAWQSLGKPSTRLLQGSVGGILNSEGVPACPPHPSPSLGLTAGGRRGMSRSLRC